MAKVKWQQEPKLHQEVAAAQSATRKVLRRTFHPSKPNIEGKRKVDPTRQK